MMFQVSCNDSTSFTYTPTMGFLLPLESQKIQIKATPSLTISASKHTKFLIRVLTRINTEDFLHIKRAFIEKPIRSIIVKVLDKGELPNSFPGLEGSKTNEPLSSPHVKWAEFNDTNTFHSASPAKEREKSKSELIGNRLESDQNLEGALNAYLEWNCNASVDGNQIEEALSCAHISFVLSKLKRYAECIVWLDEQFKLQGEDEETEVSVYILYI